MKSATFAFLAAAITPSTTAHYTFSGLIVNDEMVGKDWQYVRQHQNSYMPTKWKNIPSGSHSPDDTDFRCNKGASSGASTSVYTVKPGDKVALKQAFGGTGMAHPGPAQVYMSKAPSGDVKSYAGDGDWFKIAQSLICTPGSAESLKTNAWCSYGDDSIAFTVPSDIGAGEYLARVEHIGLHGAHGGEAEFYYACAQLKIEGGSGNSTVTPTVKIPGMYKSTDPAVNFSVWGKSTCYDEIPGPNVISGGVTEGSACGTSSGSTTGGAISKAAAPATDYLGTEYLKRSVVRRHVGGLTSRAARRYRV